MAGANFALIGEILDIPVPTAKSRFRYGIEKLRKTIAHYDL
jgi:DNA-directed RNA polymerase specialized sigma24 family protein